MVQECEGTEQQVRVTQSGEVQPCTHEHDELCLPGRVLVMTCMTVWPVQISIERHNDCRSRLLRTSDGFSCIDFTSCYSNARIEGQSDRSSQILLHRYISV